MFIAANPFLPAIPVIVYLLYSSSGTSETIIVPGSSGRLVFFILIGIPAALTGNIASS